MKITRRNFLGNATGAGACTAFWPFIAEGQESPSFEGQHLRWPANQALPTFRQPCRLDVADLTKLTGDQQALLTTL